MLDHIKTENILFIDIETVPALETHSQLSELMKKLWDRKAGFLKKENETPEELYERAGIYSEFGKIICISAGYLNSEKEFRIKSFFGDDENILLMDFIQLLNQHYNGPQHLLCAHNGKEFDYPYIARRMLINGLKLPEILNIAGKKPWEIAHLDTMELWKFGDYKNYTSLNLLAAIFEIQTPKSDMEGSDVANVYWKDKDLERIVNYCQKDTLTVAQLIMRFKGEPLIDENNVVVLEAELTT